MSSPAAATIDPVRFVSLRALFAQELVALRVPPGPGRRRGAVAHGRALVNAVNEELDEIDEHHRMRLSRLRDSAASVTDLALELVAFLYAAGAPHARWRRWASLAAFGNHLAGDLVGALRYGALAGEWDYLDRLSTLAPPSRQLVDRALWEIVGGEPLSETAPAAGAYPEAWRALAIAIPGKDTDRAGHALAVLADDWLASVGDWREYSYRAFPCFDTALGAVAALARRAGLSFEGLSEDQRAALDPGLGEGELAPPMFGRVWRL